MKYILPIFILLFCACSVKDYEATQTKIIIIKSPKLKFADVGYIRNTSKNIELELFIAGKPVEKFTLNHLICTDDGCMSKSGFNADYLHSSYPDDILQNILLGKQIYGGENRVQSKLGFEQKIKNEYVNIIYKVNSSEIYFKDKRNKILFKIKDTK